MFLRKYHSGRQGLFDDAGVEFEFEPPCQRGKPCEERIKTDYGGDIAYCPYYDGCEERGAEQ